MSGDYYPSRVLQSASRSEELSIPEGQQFVAGN